MKKRQQLSLLLREESVETSYFDYNDEEESETEDLENKKIERKQKIDRINEIANNNNSNNNNDDDDDEEDLQELKKKYLKDSVESVFVFSFVSRKLLTKKQRKQMILWIINHKKIHFLLFLIFFLLFCNMVYNLIVFDVLRNSFSDSKIIIPYHYASPFRKYESFPSFRMELAKLTRDITLVTHGTEERFSNFRRVVERWDGPIAVSFYLREKPYSREYDNIIAQLKTLGRKVEFVASNHDEGEKTNTEEQDHHRHSTSSSFSTSKGSISVCFYATNQEYYQGFYPVNTMRNAAIKLVRTEFIFVIDMDLAPDLDLRSFLLSNFEFMKKHAKDYVFVVPLFQHAVPNVPAPSNFSHLQQQISDQIIKTGYKRVTHVGHAPTNYERWLENKKGDQGEWYQVEFVNRYEPYIIAHRLYTPLYDERFSFYSHDKTSHAQTLDRMGFKFVVVPNHFLVHLKHRKGKWSHDGLDHFIANDYFKLNRINSLIMLQET